MADFDEYANPDAWQLAPPRPMHREFVREVLASWRAAGGEPDIAPALVGHLNDAGFTIREAIPRAFCVRPADLGCQWRASFLEVYPDRLIELGRAAATWADRVRREFRAADADPRTRVITPLLLEIIAERPGGRVRPADGTQ